MRGFLNPKNVIVWFGVLIKVHKKLRPNSGSKFKLGKKIHTKNNNDCLSFQLNDYNILSYYEI